VLDERKAYRRISNQLKTHITRETQNLCARRYSPVIYFGFGYPSSWRARLIGQHIACEEQKIMRRLLTENK
jgi:hypothetical protein